MNNYLIKSDSISLIDKTNRIYFPKAWSGLSNDALEKITGVKGALFCHTNRFLLTANTQKKALELAKIAIEVNEKS